MIERIRLGVIGLSEGNGHPYSWSAICNGYEPQVMADCGFPAIPNYLSRHNFPHDGLAGVEVTHVWAQDTTIATHIARAARISTVCIHYTEMIGKVDGVLLARDDASNHFELARPFLDAGLPIYIDKPVALTLEDFDRLYAYQLYEGQIFTCSALRFAEDLKFNVADREAIGAIRDVYASTPKDWQRYALHVIEPTLALLGNQGGINATKVGRTDEGVVDMSVTWHSGVRAHFVASGKSTQIPITFRVIGTEGRRDLFFRDAFQAFKAALQEFVAGMPKRGRRADYSLVRQSIELLARGGA